MLEGLLDIDYTNQSVLLYGVDWQKKQKTLSER
jgi:hypothetical protein